MFYDLKIENRVILNLIGFEFEYELNFEFDFLNTLK